MKSAPIPLPDHPPNGLTAGIDWSRDDHAVSIVDARGRQIVRATIEHSDAGLHSLVRLLAKHGVGEVAIERPDGPVIDTLLEAGLTVVVISPNQVKNLRGRYGSAGNKDDRFDAFVLADTLRTDPIRLRPLTPDNPATVTLRRACRARKDLVAHRVAMANQLREHLKRVFPAAVGLFADIDSPISLRFLSRFDCQDRADWLSPKRLAAWLASVGYCGRTDPAVLHARLTAAPRGVSGDQAITESHVTRAFLAVLQTVTEQIKALSMQIDEQLALHTDAHIFTSLPRAGRIRAARLLAEIGDCRARFPTPESLACLAGVAPSTRQSGKIRSVGFRWSCDKQLRDAVTDFAGDSRRANPWAADLYDRAITRGHDHPHAVRILARAWIYVIWHCWQDGVAYNPDQHGALQRLIQSRNDTAA
ncbi:IS110 family transposase [Mycobacterium sp. CVI_P3]|uniref:IS110 family transposase n=1 Tax=Mycobacterium pinniadriaticum TaxID=2994102 RepID=A0ABT3SDZ0_9MYCO|nr:IS110 family transposase [Mycobacterium pinniadriaticum]MCX2931301.1 IS110 family transposase [Mycobacterium pinniadriaticum]MCX2937725.1 IS110 family transposase [Mycobacterium pinniadriaticum]